MPDRIHTVIFDMDGTLSDSAILTMAAFRTLAPDHGLPIPSEEAVRRITGNPTPEFYYMLFPDFPRDRIFDFGQLVEQEELRVLPSLGGTLLFEGCRELLMRLKEGGIRLHIASTGSREHVFSVLDGTGITGFFDTVSCGHPDKIKMLREMIDDREKSGYIMVGDMKKDYEGARANGIVSVGACYGYCIEEQTDFDFYISKPSGLLEFIK